MSIEEDIVKIDRKIEELRKDWLKASPTMRKFISTGANLLKARKVKLEQKLAQGELF